VGGERSSQHLCSSKNGSGLRMDFAEGPRPLGGPNPRGWVPGPTPSGEGRMVEQTRSWVVSSPASQTIPNQDLEHLPHEQDFLPVLPGSIRVKQVT